VAGRKRRFSRLAVITALSLTVAAPTLAKARIMTPHTNHQFRQVQLPTGVPNRYRPGLWTLNPGTGRLRLCVLGSGDASSPVMACSPWSGAGAVGRYYLMPMQNLRYGKWHSQPGLWILNRRTGTARACVITDLKDPTGALKCSSTQ